LGYYPVLPGCYPDPVPPGHIHGNRENREISAGFFSEFSID
jgi:hypothetical protein